jgi:hypothetical protein
VTKAHAIKQARKVAPAAQRSWGTTQNEGIACAEAFIQDKAKDLFLPSTRSRRGVIMLRAE